MSHSGALSRPCAFLALMLSALMPAAAAGASGAVYYDFGEIEDGTVRDMSGSGYHASIEGELDVLPGGIRFTGNGALLIPGVDAMNVGGGGFTVEVLLEPEEGSRWVADDENLGYIAMGAYESDPRAWALGLSDNHAWIYVRDAGGSWRPAATSLQPLAGGEPVHVTGSRGEDGRFRLYVNGTMEHVVPRGDIDLDRNIHVSVGARMPDFGRPVKDVVIRELRLHPRAVGEEDDPILERGRSLAARDGETEAAESFRALGMSMNGRGLRLPGAPVRFEPGRMNVFTVAPEGPGDIDVELSMRTPDGRVKTVSASAGPGRKAELLLGPMTEPPVYEFESGVVYRRGYGLEVILRDSGGGEVFHQNYH